MKVPLILGAASIAVIGVVAAGALTAEARHGEGGAANGGQVAMQRGSGGGGGGGYQASLESRAKVLGMSADELKTQLETKTMSQIAVEKGMTEDEFRAKMQDAAKARWEARGLSDEEIAQRLVEHKERHEANSADHEFGSGEGEHRGGYRNGHRE